MDATDDRKRVLYLLIGLLVLFAPALIVLATLEALILLGDLELADLTVIEVLELYLLDLTVLVVLALIAYRLLGYAIDLPVLTESAGDEDDSDGE